MERGEWEGIDSCIIRNFMDQNQHECLICNLPLVFSLIEPNLAQAKQISVQHFKVIVCSLVWHENVMAKKIGNVTG